MLPAANFDSAWKDALESYFKQFLALLWPALHAQVDWRQPPVFKDKELQALMRSAKRGQRHVDKLVSVRLCSGEDSLLLIHVEVQARQEAGFAQRMYSYYARLCEKHPDHPIVSLAVLTDVRARNTDTGMAYRAEFWHCSLEFRFPVVCLESWRVRAGELRRLAPSNAFAVVVLAQLDANATRPDTHRLVRKTALLRQLHRWGYNEDNVRVLLRVIDAMMVLPEGLEAAFEEAIRKLEEETQMTYITSVERVRLKRERQEGRAEGVAEGRAEGVVEGRAEGKAEGFVALLSTLITRKFGVLPDWAKVRLVAADEVSLSRWAEQILDAECIEDVFR